MWPVAKKTLIIDDLTGDAGARTRTFALEGTDYEIDLTEVSFAELRAVLKPFIRAARPVAGSRSPAASPRRPRPRPAASAGTSAATSSAATIRSWARGVGIAVPDRGRVPADVRAQWEAAGSPVPS